jgi:hypothetical protein
VAAKPYSQLARLLVYCAPTSTAATECREPPPPQLPPTTPPRTPPHHRPHPLLIAACCPTTAVLPPPPSSCFTGASPPFRTAECGDSKDFVVREKTGFKDCDSIQIHCATNVDAPALCPQTCSLCPGDGGKVRDRHARRTHARARTHARTPHRMHACSCSLPLATLLLQVLTPPHTADTAPLALSRRPLPAPPNDHPRAPPVSSRTAPPTPRPWTRLPPPLRPPPTRLPARSLTALAWGAPT